jgi:hopene-associated glycosyltransferase HpnB
MHLVAIAAGAASVLVWFYLLAARGGFWRAAPRTPARAAAEAASGLASRLPSRRIAAVIPARNEAGVVARCIASLLQQDGGHALHIFLVDDNSDDGTARAARDAAARLSAEAFLTVIPGRPLPPGWTGKMWAVEQGIERAGALAPDYFLLTDADVVHAPENLAALVAIAEARGCDLASFMVELRCATLPQKLLVPPFVFFFFKLYPPRWISDPRRGTAGAAGGCMLLRPAALARAGGIGAIRGAIIDDCALAAAVKRSGGRLWLGLTRSARSLRDYPSFAQIGRMISRTAFNQLAHSPWRLAAAVVGLALTYLAPPALLLSRDLPAMAMGAAAWAMMTLAYLLMTRFYGLNPLWALSLPLAAAFYMGATLHSAFRYWLGRGGEWKGRVQDPAGRVRPSS